MPHIPLLPPEQASSESRAVYDNFYRRMSFPAPPNFIMTQGHSSAVARGTWDLVRNILVGGEIPRWKKELIFVAISQERKCHYCEAAHIACCRMLGVDPATLAAIAKDVSKLPDPVLRDMILFSLKCAREPGKVEKRDYDVLLNQGVKLSEVLELIAMAGVAVYANIMADATAMDPDELFKTLSA